MRHLMHDLWFIVRNWRYLKAHNAFGSELRNWWNDYDHEPYDPQAPTMDYKIHFYDNKPPVEEGLA